jgi:flagellar biosynthetic protein FliO
METPDIAQYIFSLLVVLAMIAGLAYAIKRFGLAGKIRHNKSLGGHMEVLDVLYLDARRRLMLVKCKEKEYVVLMAGEQTQFLHHSEGGSHDAPR